MVAVADILVEVGQETAKELCDQYGDRVIFVKCDITNKEDCEGVFKQTAERLGPVEVLINNAGMVGMTMDVWDKLVAVNLTSVITMTKLAMDHMSKDNGGSGGIIVNISSIAGVDVCPGSGLYAATKHAVTGFTRTMAANARTNPSWGVKVFALGPCWVRTDMTRNWHENLEAINKKSPAVYKYIMDTGGFVEPEVVSEAMISLLSEEPANEDFMIVTGHGTKYLNFRALYESVLCGQK